jgi:hypothetical protein
MQIPSSKKINLDSLFLTILMLNNGVNFKLNYAVVEVVRSPRLESAEANLEHTVWVWV